MTKLNWEKHRRRQKPTEASHVTTASDRYMLDFVISRGKALTFMRSLDRQLRECGRLSPHQADCLFDIYHGVRAVEHVRKRDRRKRHRHHRRKQKAPRKAAEAAPGPDRVIWGDSWDDVP